MNDPRPPRALPLLALFVHGISAAAWMGLIWAGLRLVGSGSALLGIALAAIGLATFVLAVRRFLGVLGRSDHSRFGPSGELPREQFDYIVWVAIGLPLAFALMLLAGALSGGLD